MYIVDDEQNLDKVTFECHTVPVEANSAALTELAAATFHAFFPYINVSDCGKKLWDEKERKLVPKHMITKEAFSFATIRQGLPDQQRKVYRPIFERGKSEGKPFHYWAHYLNRRFDSAKIIEHIQGVETYYYTSSGRGRAVAYLDIDAHSGQEDELQAKRLLHDNLCSCSLWNHSDHGQNGYLKIHYGPVCRPDLTHQCFAALSPEDLTFLRERIAGGLSARQINGLFARAEKAYRRFLEFHGITCTFEIKGKVTEYTVSPADGTFRIKSGSLAKLPFKGWTWERLAEFKKLKEVPWYVWERQIELLERMLDEKESARTVFMETAALENIDHSCAPAIAPAVQPPKQKRSITSFESCAFTRNRIECLRFVRNFYRKHGRVATHAEFLDYLQRNGLFTGEWNDPDSDRFSRTARVLDYALQTFDPKKLGHGEGRWNPLPVMTWLRDYARGHFGSLTATVVKDKNNVIFCDEGIKSGRRRIQECYVPARFVHHCVWVILTCMEDLPENDGLPEDRIVKAWSLLPGAPRWNRDYYAIVRDHLEQREIVEIYDKNHGPKKCWRWRKGKNYPYSPDQQKAKGKLKCSVNVPLSVSRFIINPSSKITPCCKAEVISTHRVLCWAQCGRPPPECSLKT